MRQHLYRGKRVDNGEWVYGDLLTPTDIMDIWEISENTGMGNRYDIDPETGGEWTGLTDKNGIKIFEGDIVQGEAEDARGVVEWQHSECRYLINIRNGYDWLCMDDDKWCVIGNIHDNSELLEGGK